MLHNTPAILILAGPVVQWIEHHRPKVGVGGSSPSRATKIPFVIPTNYRE